MTLEQNCDRVGTRGKPKFDGSVFEVRTLTCLQHHYSTYHDTTRTESVVLSSPAEDRRLSWPENTVGYRLA